MKKFKGFKTVTAVLLAVIISAGCALVSASAASSEYALIASSDTKISGSAQVRGNALITGGKLEGGYNPWSTGTIFTAPGVSVKNPSDPNKGIVKDYTGTVPSYRFESYSKAPETTYFLEKGTQFKDWTKDLTVGSGEFKNGFVLKTDAFIRNLTVPYDTTLTIDALGGVAIIRVGKLTNNGIINIKSGKAVIYVDEIGSVNNGSFNTGSASDNGGKPEYLTMFINDYSKNINMNYAKFAGNIIVPYSNFHMNSTAMTGNVYAGKDVMFDGDNKITGLVYAPESQTKLAGSSYIKGQLITNTLDLSGSGYIGLGGFQELPSDIIDGVGDKNNSQITGGGAPQPEEPTQPAPETPAQPGGSDNSGSEQPTEPSAGGNTDTQPSDGEVTITAVVARRMSIRLEDGRILKSGDKFNMPKYGTIRFQVCTNNWDTNTYTDDGQGLAGPVVYEFTHKKNKELYLRVDNDRYFMPVRFHFEKGDYSKLTGVDQVLSTPLESLSINFPLGATVNVKAFVKSQVVDSQNIFVDSNLEWYNWPY